MGNKINININGLFTQNYDAGVPIEEIAHDYKKVTNKTIMGARINKMIVEYDTKLYKDTRIDFFDYMDLEGNKMYQSGLKFLLIIACKRLWNKNVFIKYSLDRGIYVEFENEITDANIQELKAKMKELVDYAYPIKRCLTNRMDAITYFLSINDKERASNVQNIPNKYVELFEIDHTYNFFYSRMPWNTSELKIFDLERIDKNSILLLYPRPDANGTLPDFYYNNKIYDELKKYSSWSKAMGTEYVDELNNIVANGQIQKYIKMNNIMINDSLYIIAKEIVQKREKVKMILIGGPSSSGKTTSAHKLCMYLETFGLKPIVISADDYFKERGETPKGEDGTYDFENLEAIDLKLFNKQINDLLNNKEVVLPKFDFVNGTKLFTSSPIKMNDDNILLIEGIHCLNDEMTSSIKRENKYKVFVCPFTPLGLDAHNYLSTTDMRLIRRIIRDYRTRGRSAEATLENYPKVKRGEEKNIFPFTKDVDAVLNTAYAYEVGVLRVYVEPLLYNIPMHSVYYEEARRLIGFLHIFYPITSEYIEDDNTLREFIGGSIYER